MRHRIGSDIEEIEVTIRMKFGNVSGIEFLRSLGPLAPNGGARRSIVLGTSESTAIVTGEK